MGQSVDTPRHLRKRELTDRTGLTDDDLDYLVKRYLIEGEEFIRNPGRPHSYLEAAVPFLKEVARLRLQGLRVEKAVAQARSLGRSTDAPQRSLLREVNGDDLARLLTAFCRVRGLSNEETVASLRKLGDTYRALGIPSPAARSTDPVAECLSGKSFDLDALTFFSETFQVPRLLLYPLLSTPSDADVIRLRRLGDFPAVSGPKTLTKEYGEHCTYHVPWERLRRTDASFGVLTIKPGGRSDFHSHPGDELVLVLSGQIRMEFPRSGLSTVLGRGDYIHFYAEMQHEAFFEAVDAGKDEAEVFVIRFYQLDRLDGSGAPVVSPREEALKWIRETRERFSREEPPPAVTEQLVQWIQAIAYLISEPPPSLERSTVRRSDKPSEFIQDFSGLGRLLSQRPGRTEPKQRFWKPSDLGRIELGLWNGIKTTASRRDKSRLGRPTKEDLIRLAKAYRVPCALLYHYFCPAVPGVIVVRHSDGYFSGEQFGPEEDLRPYRIPKRNLMCSDVSIARLVVDEGDKGCQIPTNFHAGSELILPLEGQVTIEVNGRAETAFAELGECLHFDSEKPHSLSVPSGKKTDSLLVRFSHKWG